GLTHPARLIAAEPTPPTAAVRQLAVYPPQIALAGPRAEQRLGVLATHADGRQWDHARTATYASADPAVATVDAAGTVRPAADGHTTVTVTAAGATASVPVTVTGVKTEEPVNFTRDVEAVITKAGC